MSEQQTIPDYTVLVEKHGQNVAKQLFQLISEIIADENKQKQRRERKELIELREICEKSKPLTTKDKVFVAGKCLDLVDQYYEAVGQEADASPVYEWIKTSCQNGSLYSCYQQAIMLSKGKGVPQDSSQGEKLIASSLSHFQSECQNDNGAACNELAKLSVMNGDTDTALKYFEKACELSEGEACHNAGVTYYNLKKGKETFDYFNKGCDAGNAVSCSYLARCYFEGSGTKLDWHVAFLKTMKACDLGGCDERDLNLWVSTIFEKGKRWDLLNKTKPDPKQAIDYAEKSCACGFLDGCLKAAHLYRIGKDPNKSDKIKYYYKKACAMGSLNGCEELFWLLNPKIPRRSKGLDGR